MDVIHLTNLNSLTILLEKTIRYKFWDDIIQKFGSQYKLGDFLGTGQYTISRWRSGKLLVPIKIIIKLKHHTKLKLNDIEKSALKLGSAQGSSPLGIKLPLKMNEDLAYLMGLVITDGHLNKALLWIQFASKETVLRKLFTEKITEVFGHNRFYICPKPSLSIYVKNKALATIFWKLGIPKGRKCDIVSVPKSIFSSSDKIIRAFLRGCFDGDGSVACSQGLRIINYATSSRQMAEDIGLLLSRLSIKYFITTNVRNITYVNITNRTEIEKFKELIGFNHPERMKRLQTILKSYKIYNFCKGENKEALLNVMRDERKYTIKQLSAQIKRAKTTTYGILKKLINENKISFEKRKTKRTYTYYYFIKN